MITVIQLDHNFNDKSKISIYIYVENRQFYHVEFLNNFQSNVE